VTLDAALAYAANGYPVIPLHRIVEPASADVVKAFASGELSKKVACLRARCGCGKLDCQSPGKHPIGPGATAATTSENIIREWWTRWPDANIGVRLPPGVLAVDFDLYAPGVAERLAAFAETNAPTVIQESGAGGEHWLYTFPPDIAPPAWGTSLDGQSGIDLIHHGHRYIVAEPSTHWTGGSYTWRASPVISTLAPATPELMARCTRGARPIAGQSPITSSTSKYAHVRAYRPDHAITPCPEGVAPADWAILLARKMPPAIEDGQEGGEEHGHVTLARAGARLVAGLCLDPTQAVGILWEHYNPRCVPPWNEDGDGKDNFEDFERIVLNAGRDIPPEERGFLLPPSARQSSDPEGVPAARPTWLSAPLDFSAEPPPPNWLCEGLEIEAGAKTSQIAGFPGGGKGPFSNLFTISVALGLPFLGKFPVKQGGVLVLDWETGDRRSISRIRRMCRSLGVDPATLSGRLHFHSMYGGVPMDIFQWLYPFVRTEGINLIVVDSYTSAMMMAGKESHDPEYASFMSDLGDAARALDVTTMPIVHARKSERRASARRRPDLEDISGTGALVSMAQSVLMLWRPDAEQKNVIEVSCARAVENGFAPFSVRWEDESAPSGGTLGGRASADPKWGLKAVIVADVQPQPDSLKSRAEANKAVAAQDREIARQRLLKALQTGNEGAMLLRRAVEIGGGNSRATKEALRSLVDDGLVLDLGGGQGYIYNHNPPTPVESFRGRPRS
jgi:hypothetical protein